MTNKLTETEMFIVNYLFDKGWTPPTKIARAYRYNYHSAWASPKCKRLVDKGYLLRNDDGHYRLIPNNV